jgi:azurin
MVNWTAVLLAAAWMDAPPARLIPPIAPGDLAGLIAKDPTADPEAAKRMLAENGVPPDRRRAAADALRGAGPAHSAVIDAIVACAGTCGATRDLDDLLVSMAAEVAVDPAALARLATAASDPASPLRLAALRTIAAMPEAARPEAWRGTVVRTIRLKAIPGAMKYDVTDVKAAPGEVLEFILENPDTMQHNLLIVAPGKMPEVGVAGDKMGETAAGKAWQFVPDLPSVLAAMGLVDPGASGRVHWVVPTKTGTYPYVCTYPGHWRMMNGKIKVTAPAPK